MYNKKKFGQYYVAELKRLSKRLLVAKQKAQEKFTFGLTKRRRMLERVL